MSGGDSLTLDGSMSMSDTSDPENPPGNMSYLWAIETTVVAQQTAMVTIPWDPNPLDPAAQSLTGTFGFAKGITANTYYVGISVADNNGSDIKITTVTVAANSDPIPYISSSNGVNADDEIHIRAFDSLNLDGSMTTDADMFDTRTYSWDIMADGTVEFTGEYQSVVTISWEDLVSDYGFAVGGMYPVSLTVNDGYVDRTTSVTVFVDNTGPFAAAVGLVPGGCYDIYVGESLDLDASDSSDPDDAPNNSLTFAWDLDNDGDFDDETGETPQVTWANFSSLVGYTSGVQSYQIAVKVSDGDLDATATATVNVHLPILRVAFEDGTMGERPPGPQDNGSFRIYRETPIGAPINNISFTLPGGPGRATNGNDYNTITTTGWSIGANDTFVEIPITLIWDNEPESYIGNSDPHTELFVVSLNDATANNYVVNPSEREVTTEISDNDRWDWDTATGGPPNNADSVGVSGYDYALDAGPATLGYGLVDTLTNNSIDVSLSGYFINPGIFTVDSYSFSASLRIAFEVNDYGYITLDPAGSNSNPGYADDILDGYLPAQYVIDNVARTATVRFAGIGVVVDGSVSPVAPFAGFTAFSVLNAGASYTFSSSGAELVMATWDVNFQLKIVELP